jgi:hypothetical protein
MNHTDPIRNRLYFIMIQLVALLPLVYSTESDPVVSDNATESTESTPYYQLPDGVMFNTIIEWHLFCMLIGFMILPPIGIFIARYLKSTLGQTLD